MRPRLFAIATFSLTIAVPRTLTDGHTRDRCGLACPSHHPSPQAPLDGRLLLFIATDDHREPRFQIADGDRTAQVFGIDADSLPPGQEAFVDDAPRLSDAESEHLKPGDYWVQGLLHVYETFTRSDGHR